jgi:hypothetical protein
MSSQPSIQLVLNQSVDRCGFKVAYVGRQLSHDCMKLILSSSCYSNKNMTEEVKLFSVFLYINVSCYIFKNVLIFDWMEYAELSQSN